MQKRALVLLGMAATVALCVVGARYTRRVGAALTAINRTTAGGRPTVHFVRNPAPVGAFTVTDLDGRTISSGSWRGRVTLVNFWATWCPPCRAEIPDLIALQSKFGDRLQIIGVAMDDAPPEIVRTFARREGINYPVVMVTDELRRGFPGVFALPTSFLVDRRGRTVQKHVGLIAPAEYELEARVLAGLANDAVVEEVNDAGQVLLANAALATEIPGLDLARLAPADRQDVLVRLNRDSCGCGCSLTLAQCRINDPDCAISLPIAKQIVETIAGRPGS